MGNHGNSFTSFPAAAAAVGGWVELGRTTLGSPNDQINVSGLSDKRYYMVLTSIQNNGQIIAGFRLNGDTAGNYAFRNSINGGADTPTPNTTHLAGLTLGTTSSAKFVSNKVLNEPAAVYDMAEFSYIMSIWR